MSDVELALSIYAQHAGVGGSVAGVKAVWYAGYRAGRSDTRKPRSAVVAQFMDALDEMDALGLTDIWLEVPGVRRDLARLVRLIEAARPSSEPT